MRPSPRAAGLIAMVWALAVCGLWNSGVPLPGRLALSLAASAYALAAIRNCLHPPIRQIRMDDGVLKIITASGQQRRLQLGKRSVVSRFFIGLPGRDGDSNRPIRLGLFADQLDRDDRRRLSAWLRAGLAQGVSSAVMSK